MSLKYGKPVSGVLMALLFAGAATILLTFGYSYSRASSLFPRFAGWIFLALALTELLIRLTELVRSGSAGAGTPASENGRATGDWTRAAQGFAWLTAMLAGIWLAGFLVATPAFIFTFLRIAGRRSAMRSAVIAATATACVWLGFVELLGYELFSGVLFPR